MAEPNQPTELAPIQPQERHPSQRQTPADDALAVAPGESSSPTVGGQRPDPSVDESASSGRAEFEGEISAPAPEGEFLTSPEQARAQAKETADRMGVFRGLPRELTEKEWNTGGTRKLILERMTRLESELTELKRYRSQYYERDKESAVLRQQLRQLTAADRLSDFCLAVGGVLIGLATFLFDQGHWILGLVVVLIGIVLLAWPVWLKHDPKPD